MVVEGTSTVASSSPCSVAAPIVAPERGTVLPLPPGAVLTDVTEQTGQRLATGRVEAGVEEVLAHFRAAAASGGYVVQRDEDEGRAGRLLLFGSAGEIGVTVARLTCPRGATGFTLAVPLASKPAPSG